MAKSDSSYRDNAGESDARRALLVQRLKGTQAEAPPARISKGSQVGLLPLSYTQQRVWFLQQLFPDNRAYNMSEAWRLRGPLDVPGLQQALAKVVQRHPSLRTRFVAPEDIPMQAIAADVELPLPATDISHLANDEREDTLRQLLLAEGNHAFDLSSEPLIRPSLIRLGPEEHVLQLVLHHIVTDEWSNDIIWQELAFYYEHPAAEEEQDLPEEAIHYTDYANWQRQQVSSGALDGQMAYWQRQLEGELPMLQLPSDRPRPAEQSLRGGTVRRMLPAQLLQGLQSLSQEAGATLFVTLLAGYQALLHRYGGQEDILVGTPIGNRQRAETERVVGMFINTAVLRGHVSPDMTFRQLLSQVQQTALDALANQDLPFDLLVQALHPERDLSYNPLFQTMFVFHSQRAERKLGGLTFEPIKIDRGVAKFDLTLFAAEEDGHLLSALEYSSDLFDEDTALRMLDHWQTLLASIVADPDAPLGHLPLLTAEEVALLMNRWNDTSIPFRETRCIHELITAQAAQRPEALAVISGEERLTYSELESRADRLAQRLQRRGVAVGTPVGLFVERSADMIAGILGILKAGGAYVPLEPAYPAERIAFSVADTGAPLIVTQAHLVQEVPLSEAKVVVLDAELDSLSGPEHTALSLDDLAYIIYTSGSTGTPKGVMVTHRNLLASTLAREQYYQKPVGRYLLLSSFAFDSSVAGIFWTLANGGALVLPAPGDEKDVHKLASLIAQEEVTHTLALPTLYRLLLSYAPRGSLDSLQVVIVAGEACPPDLGQEHYGQLPNSALYNEYGPTEATVWCSVYRLSRDSVGSTVPIGRPIANAQLYVLDDRQQLLPIGVPGELYVGGAGVTPGYWQQPQLTAAEFPQLGFAGGGPETRVYRTGDLARWRADGELEFLGRVDDQVKIRGFRIEPGEIEAVLLQHPQVEEAAVTVWAQPGVSANQDRSLIAYVSGEQFKNGAQTDAANILAYLGEALPEYMVPRQVIVLPSLPHTPNGKVDRQLLPEPQFGRDGKRPFVPPRNMVQEKLAQIWCDTLGLPQVSVEDKFFELGGDSIMSIQVVARARQEGLALTPRQLFQEQTIARLAAVATPVEQAALPRETSGMAPLTPIQHWFFSQELSQAGHWNQAAWFETAADLRLHDLQRALDGVIAHHPTLRARFYREDGRWRQEVLNEVPSAEIESLDLVGLSPPAQDEALLAKANSLHADLDLSRAPLLRAAWFDLGDHRPPRLFLTIHHLVVDAVSWSILTADLIAAYKQISLGAALSLPAVTTDYARWSATQARLAQSEALQREAAYWCEVSRDAAPLPRDGAGGSNREGEADLITVTLDREHTGPLLRDVHETYRTRMDDILLAALARAVCGWSGTCHLLLTMERHGREDIDPQLDLSRTAGWFTSLSPLMLVLPEEGDEGPAIRAVKEQLRAVPQNGIGYGMLRFLADEDTRRKLAAQPQPEILFNYLGIARQSEHESDPLRPLTADTGQAYGPRNSRAHLIDVNVQMIDGRLVARWQYAPAYFLKATIERVARTFIAELTQLIDHCLSAERGQHTPSDFPLADLQQDDLDALSDLLSGVE